MSSIALNSFRSVVTGSVIACILGSSMFACSSGAEPTESQGEAQLGITSDVPGEASGGDPAAAAPAEDLTLGLAPGQCTMGAVACKGKNVGDGCGGRKICTGGAGGYCSCTEEK